MTIEEVQLAIDIYESEIVTISSNDNSVISCILQDVFSGSEQDSRGYDEPYLYIIRIDKDENPTEVFMCSEMLAIDML